MNKTLMYLQADMHRAINDGRKSFEVSVLDMKELLGAVAAAEGREQFEKLGQVFGFINSEKLADMRGGRRFYCTIRLRKREDFDTPVFCEPERKPPIDVVA